jgi:hypothetical protein
MGCLATLSQFISRLVECAFLFFKLLQKSGPFSWTQKADEIFQELKQYLASLSVMLASEPSEPVLLYITATTEVVSMVLIIERPKPQQPQSPKGTPAVGSGSHDLNPAGEPRDKEVTESQLPEPAVTPRKFKFKEKLKSFYKS